jgi:hypothetical protein
VTNLFVVRVAGVSALLFGLGYSFLGLAIVRTGALSRILGWILLLQSGFVGLIGFPAQYFRVPGASVVVLAGMMVFFLWLIAAGVALLRWRPPASVS